MLLVRGNTGGSLNTAFLRVSPNVVMTSVPFMSLLLLTCDPYDKH